LIGYSSAMISFLKALNMKLIGAKAINPAIEIKR
jgi:hypothetical protein